jgi:cation:H+ antiporter
MIATPLMVRSSATISDITGLGTSFIGSTLVAIITSLPELVTSIAALKNKRPGNGDGQLIRQQHVQYVRISVDRHVLYKRRFIGAIDQSFLIAGMLGVLLTSLALVGNVTSFRRFRHMESDSVIMTIIYLAGTYLLYIQSRV